MQIRLKICVAIVRKELNFSYSKPKFALAMTPNAKAKRVHVAKISLYIRQILILLSSVKKVGSNWVLITDDNGEKKVIIARLCV